MANLHCQLMRHIYINECENIFRLTKWREKTYTEHAGIFPLANTPYYSYGKGERWTSGLQFLQFPVSTIIQGDSDIMFLLPQWIY